MSVSDVQESQQTANSRTGEGNARCYFQIPSYVLSQSARNKKKCCVGIVAPNSGGV
jgi:hypothetical protein